MEPITFQIKQSKAAEKIEEVLKYPEGLLKRFRPAGVNFTNKIISNNVISFEATKAVLFLSHTVRIKGTLYTEEVGQGCAQNQRGYKLTLVLDGSDTLVVDNIDRLEAILCTSVVQSNLITGIAKGIIYKGSHYSNLFGPVAKGIIEDQVSPLLKALNEEIQAMKQ